MPPKAIAAKAKAAGKAKALPKAKAGAKAKAKAKARAKAKGAPRPRLRPRSGLRRPAAEVADPPPVPGVEGPRDTPGFGEGGLVHAEGVPSHLWTEGSFVAFEGSYWQGKAEVAGLVRRYHEDGGKKEVELEVKGTTTERLLRWGSGHKLDYLRVHLCSPACPSESVADDYFHGHRVRLVKAGLTQPWMTCLEEGKHDDLRDLRVSMGMVPDEGLKEKAKSSSTSSSRSKDKKKKKKKKKKDKDRKQKKKEEKVAREKKEDLSPVGRRVRGQMPLKGVFGGTGLDPSPEVRRSFRKTARKKVGKSRKRCSSSRSSSSSSSSRSLSPENIFPETQRVRAVAKRCPGALACQSVEEMRDHLITASGQMWSQDVSGSIPPLVLHYYRTVLKAKMSGGISREAMNLAYLCDLTLQGRVAEAMDVGLQRLKSLELTSNGGDFRVSQRVELLPPETELVASNLERREAIQEAREEMKLRSQGGKGGDWWKQDSWKGGDKGGWQKRDYKGKDGKKGEKGGDRVRHEGKGEDKTGVYKKDDKKK